MRLSLAVSIAFKVSRLIGILEPRIGVSANRCGNWIGFELLQIIILNTILIQVFLRLMLWGFGVPSAWPPGASSSPKRWKEFGWAFNFWLWTQNVQVQVQQYLKEQRIVSWRQHQGFQLLFSFVDYARGSGQISIKIWKEKKVVHC